jgi:hypothetical protein
VVHDLDRHSLVRRQVYSQLNSSNRISLTWRISRSPA